MDSRTETDFREEQTRRTYASLSERAGYLQQQVRKILQSTATELNLSPTLLQPFQYQIYFEATYLVCNDQLYIYGIIIRDKLTFPETFPLATFFTKLF